MLMFNNTKIEMRGTEYPILIEEGTIFAAVTGGEDYEWLTSDEIRELADKMDALKKAQDS